MEGQSYSCASIFNSPNRFVKGCWHKYYSVCVCVCVCVCCVCVHVCVYMCVCVSMLQSGEVIYMPVPSSFNEITQNNSLRNYIGWVWYDREAWIPASWRGGDKCIMIRFESAHYNTIAVRTS